MLFKQYHFHIYFLEHEESIAKEIIRELKSFEFLRIGRLINKPIGPHPVGSCQVTVQRENLLDMLDWFSINRKGLDIFIHPVSGNDLMDHREYVMWLGNSHELNIFMFE